VSSRSARIADHLRRNVYGLVALFVALSGVAVAANTAPKDSVVSKSIKDGQVKLQDLSAVGGKEAVDTEQLREAAVTGAKVEDGSLAAADIADNSSLGTSEIDEGLLNVGGDLTGTVVNAQIAGSTIGSGEVANDTLTGTDVANTNSLGTAEISESSLVLPQLEGEREITLILEELDTQDTFSAGDPDTFTDLGLIELRSTGTAGTVDVCSPLTNIGLITYVGGGSNSTTDTRDDLTVTPSACHSLDTNGAGGSGDFRLYATNIEIFVEAVMFPSGSMDILAHLGGANL
jgi:hypothetical protein